MKSPRTPSPMNPVAGPGSRPAPGLPLAQLVVALALLLAACAGPAPAPSLHVNPVSGSDANPGTLAEPLKTLTHALTLAGPGHTIHLATGTYDEASGEVWPTFAGLPPAAAANVPNRVTITGDGNLVRLAGPIGFDDKVALVFDGEATVSGVSVMDFEVGVIVQDGATVILEDVSVSATGELGVVAMGGAELTIQDSVIAHNEAVGLLATDDANVTLAGSEVHDNHPGVEAEANAVVHITGSDLHDNGSGTPGGTNSAVSVRDFVTLTIEDSTLHASAYAGLHMQGAPDVTVGPGTDIFENFIGVVADAFTAGAARLRVDGASVRDNDFEGIFWAIPAGESFVLRDTAITGNGDNALFISGDADVIDLGSPGDPGGNDFAGNGEPLILDIRPARAAPNGTIITVSHDDLLAGCLVGPGPLVGPTDLMCDGVEVLQIVFANNRVEIVASE